MATTGPADFSPEGLHESDLQQQPPQSFLSPSVLREKERISKLRGRCEGHRQGRCWPLRLMGGLGGYDMTPLWFPCPVAWSCHSPASNTDDSGGEVALSICSADTKTHNVVLSGETQQVLSVDRYIHTRLLKVNCGGFLKKYHKGVPFSDSLIV